jgi:hypothetical protein
MAKPTRPQNALGGLKDMLRGKSFQCEQGRRTNRIDGIL